MKSVIRSAALGFVLAVAAAPAYAATFDLGTISSSETQPANVTVSASSPFPDFFQFKLTSSTKIKAGIFSTDPGLSGLSLDLYGTSGLIKSGTAGNLGPFSGATLTDSESTGSYFFKVSGSGTGSYVGSVTFTVSAVPLPASLPMFGAALLGLGGLAFAFKRKSETAQATALA